MARAQSAAMVAFTSRFQGKVMRHFKIIGLSLSCAFLLAGFQAASALDSSGKDHSHSHKGYFKPGAAVALSYDYDGETQPGELENITLKLEHYYRDGYISARLLESPDLNIISSQMLSNERLRAGSNFSLPLQLSGTAPGEHYISLEVIHESLDGQHSLRVLSLPIHIGERSKTKSANPPSQKLEQGKEKGLIILNAQEVIR